MSERTPCNYCTLESMKREYHKNLTLNAATFNLPQQYIALEPRGTWIDVFVVVENKFGEELGPRRRLASFMALTTVCAC